MIDILTNILVDPSDKGNLLWDEAQGLAYNPRLRLRYPFRNGFPRLHKNQASPAKNEEEHRGFLYGTGPLQEGDPTKTSHEDPEARIARYEGFAEYYDTIMQDDSNRGELARSAYELLSSLAGKGEGIALDIGCGTGLSARFAKNLGYDPIGVDLSADQLRVASTRLPVVLGDSAELPIASDSVKLAYSTFTTTDWDDLARSAREIYRVLSSGGRYIDVGVHPCFYGGFSEALPEGGILQKVGYNGTQYLEPETLKGSVRSKVGAWHRPLAEVLNLFLEAGFRLVRISEGGPEKLPSLLALSFIKD